MGNLVTLEELTRIIEHCHKCPLASSRTKTVVGSGNIKAKIMLVGEGPGQQEDLTGEAFVGPAGKLLDKMLAAIGLDRTKVYICNIVKCRPPHNRVPYPSEQEACIDYLRVQFLLMRPKLIILLGSTACKKLIDPNFSIMRQHGEVSEKKGVYFVPTFHPAALLRDESKKPWAWDDLKKAKQIIDDSKLA